jgi:uncharacterized protein
MALVVNIRHLQQRDEIRLNGEMKVEELDILGADECILGATPLKYDLQVSRSGEGILVEGWMELHVEFECVKCLRRFERLFEFQGWAGFAALGGEEGLPVANDCVDLTPILREDILLAFPQHPLCEAGCAGLPLKTSGSGSDTGRVEGSERASSVWAELDKLKL